MPNKTKRIPPDLPGDPDPNSPPVNAPPNIHHIPIPRARSDATLNVTMLDKTKPTHIPGVGVNWVAPLQIPTLSGYMPSMGWGEWSTWITIFGILIAALLVLRVMGNAWKKFTGDSQP